MEEKQMTQTTKKTADLFQLQMLYMHLTGASVILNELREQSDRNLRHVSNEDYDDERLANRFFTDALQNIDEAEFEIRHIIRKRSLQND